MAEPPLLPELEIVDAHIHLGEDYPLRDFAADAAGHQVAGAVYVECGWSWDESLGSRIGLPEVARAAAVAEAPPVSSGAVRLRGIVGYLDLRSDSVADDLAALVAAGSGRLAGIRVRAAWDKDPAISPTIIRSPPGLLGDPAWRRGCRELARLGLALDVWTFHTQLADVAELGRAIPDVRIVLNHLGGPLGVGEYANHDEVWRSSLRPVARCPNVYLKLGGIGMPLFGRPWAANDAANDAPSAAVPASAAVSRVWGPRLRWAIEEFGASRCMFESNFPVDKQSLPYSVLWNAYKRTCEGAGRDELTRLFAGTAIEVYALGS